MKTFITTAHAEQIRLAENRLRMAFHNLSFYYDSDKEMNSRDITEAYEAAIAWVKAHAFAPPSIPVTPPEQLMTDDKILYYLVFVGDALGSSYVHNIEAGKFIKDLKLRAFGHFEVKAT